MALKVCLISTYELGRQPFGLASAAAQLRAAGIEVMPQDLSVHRLDEEVVRAADVVAFYLPMHTATRLALQVLPRVRELNPGAHLCCFGLYGPLNRPHLIESGIDSILDGEFESHLVELCRAVKQGDEPRGHPYPPGLDRRTSFIVPDREGLPPLSNYARLKLPGGEERLVGYTEATRGCRHHCRHCPIVPVYQGRFRVIPRDVVVADVAQQVAVGAEHITFGDPDFFNAPRLSLLVLEELHAEFPDVTFDATIKVEHLRLHGELLPRLRELNCILVTSAFESFDDSVLERLKKNHKSRHIVDAVEACQVAGIALNPTFVPFTPWTSAIDYLEFLGTIADLGLVESVSPVQYGVRLLLPTGSPLLELSDVAARVDTFDPETLCYPWSNPDPAVDRLAEQLTASIAAASDDGAPRREIFADIFRQACATADRPAPVDGLGVPQAVTIPYMTEPWYC